MKAQTKTQTKTQSKTKEMVPIERQFDDRFVSLTEAEVDQLIFDTISATESVVEPATDSIVDTKNPMIQMLMSFELEEIENFIELANERLETLKMKRINDIKEAMAKLNEELHSLSGQHANHTTSLKHSSGEKAQRNFGETAWSPIVNPNNPDQIYKAGRIPEWLNELMQNTGKTVTELRKSVG